MTNVKNAVKSKAMAFWLAFLMMLQMSTPMVAFATGTEGANINDVNVTIDAATGNLVVNGGGMTNSGTSANAWNTFIGKYKNFIVGISGIGAVSMILFFVMQLMKLGASAGNPQERSKALSGLIWSGVAAAGLGSVTIIVGFFYGAFK